MLVFVPVCYGFKKITNRNIRIPYAVDGIKTGPPSNKK